MIAFSGEPVIGYAENPQLAPESKLDEANRGCSGLAPQLAHLLPLGGESNFA